MVVIEAILKPFKLDDVKEALEDLGIGGMTVIEVLQTASPKPRGRSFGALRSTGDLVPKMKVQVAAPRELVERVIEAICLHGSSGKQEDGVIMVEKLLSAIRIRTAELDDDALT